MPVITIRPDFSYVWEPYPRWNHWRVLDMVEVVVGYNYGGRIDYVAMNVVRRRDAPMYYGIWWG
jgi:hypothetical protein